MSAFLSVHGVPGVTCQNKYLIFVKTPIATLLFIPLSSPEVQHNSEAISLEVNRLEEGAGDSEIVLIN